MNIFQFFPRKYLPGLPETRGANNRPPPEIPIV